MTIDWVMKMKTLVINVKDDKKYDVLMSFLKEINFVEIQGEQKGRPIKTWQDLPASVRNPISVDSFKNFSRDELYER